MSLGALKNSVIYGFLGKFHSLFFLDVVERAVLVVVAMAVILAIVYLTVVAVLVVIVVGVLVVFVFVVFVLVVFVLVVFVFVLVLFVLFVLTFIAVHAIFYWCSRLYGCSGSYLSRRIGLCFWGSSCSV